MALYMVSYDLDKPGQDYSNLIARLKQWNAQKILFSQWFLISDATPTTIRNDLQQFMDTNDRILVCELRKNAGWDKLMITNETAQAFFSHAAL